MNAALMRFTSAAGNLGRPDDRKPTFHHVVRQALFDERRDLRRGGQPFLGADADGAQRAAFQMLLHDGSDSVPKSTCPPIRSVNMGPTPLYGTCVALTPASSRNISAARCRIVPLPDEP